MKNTILWLSVLCVTLFAPWATAAIIKLDWSGQYNVETQLNNTQPGPYHFSLTYDTSLNTSTVIVPAGTNMIEWGYHFPTRDTLYGYSASGIVAAELTFMGVTFSASDLSPSTLPMGYKADMFFNSDISQSAPTGSSVFFHKNWTSSLGLGYLTGFSYYSEAILTNGMGARGAFGEVYSSYGKFTRTVLSPVPEPSTYLLLLAGLVLVSAFAQRKSRC